MARHRKYMGKITEARFPKGKSHMPLEPHQYIIFLRWISNFFVWIAIQKAMPPKNEEGPLFDKEHSTGLTDQLQEEISSKCKTYHLQLNNLHERIYRYETFKVLVGFLENTLLAHIPYIDFPTNEILDMVLTATQLNQVSERPSDSIVCLSAPCIRYLSSLLRVFEYSPVLRNKEEKLIFKKELDTLYQKLRALFSFLIPDDSRRRKRKKHSTVQSYLLARNLSDGFSAADKPENVEGKLILNKIDSVFELSTNSDKFNKLDTFFGVQYLKEIKYSFWDSFIFAFETASKLTCIQNPEIYEIYYETWSRWRELHKLLIGFMTLEIKREQKLFNTLLCSNLMRITHVSDPGMFTDDQYEDSLLTSIRYVFASSKDPILSGPILSIDLTKSKTFASIPLTIESKYTGSGIGIESLTTRSELLNLIWRHIAALPVSEETKESFVDNVATELMKLTPRENFVFFSSRLSTLIEDTTEDLNFLVSFKMMNLISRDWSYTAYNFLENFSSYIKHIGTFISQLAEQDHQRPLSQSASDILTITGCNNSEFNLFFVLANYQLLYISRTVKFSAEEWKLLEGINLLKRTVHLNLADLLKDKL